MKLRYYLRGLGIGMIVTAFLMGMALKDGRTLSDTEIRARAAELGMVEGNSRTLADIQNPNEPEGSSADAAEPTAKPDGTTEPLASSTPGTAEPTVKPGGTTVSAGQPEAAMSTGTSGAESVTFVIRSGQSSNAVSKALAEAGLVEDAASFDKYLVDNGYSRRIRAGSYEIPLNSSEEEIAKKIAGSR